MTVSQWSEDAASNGSSLLFQKVHPSQAPSDSALVTLIQIRSLAAMLLN
jgi:hypothetical protein